MKSAPTRIATTFALSVPVLGIYSLVNGASPSAHDLAIPLDHAIPLLPWTLLFYMSLYPFLLTAAVVVEEERFRRGIAGLLLTAALSFVVFLVLPAAYPQPDPASIAPPWRAAFAALHSIDGAANTFPSLHVGSTTTIVFMLRTHRYRVLWLAWGAMIALSTLTVKQHFVVDVFGGVVVALAASLVVRWWFDRASPLPDVVE